MNKKEAFHLGLPKWPQMRVVGDPVSEELAKEIIIRTDHFFDAYHSSNSHDFDKECRKLFGMPERQDLYEEWQKVFAIYDKADATLKEKEWASKESDRLHKIEDKYWNFYNKLHEDIGYIKNAYIYNNWFSSCFIFGPHGWMNPDGTIGYIDNIGKWPDVESVYDYWVKIAKEYPMLNIRITLMDGEGCEKNIKPVVTMKVSNGKVRFSNDHIGDLEDIPVCRKNGNNIDSVFSAGDILDIECWWSLDYIQNNLLPIFNRIKTQRAKSK
jgi:hypothetical protein